MLRKLLALGALVICAAAPVHAAPVYDSNNGDGYQSGKLVVPDFCDNKDVIKWAKDLEHHDDKCNLFDQIVTGNQDLCCLDLPKCDVRILKDLTGDVEDLLKDLKDVDHDHHDDKYTKDDSCKHELWQDIKCDATDIRNDACELEYHLQNGCGCNDVQPSTTAVPLPAAAAQGMIGIGGAGIFLLLNGLRRRKAAAM